jgi:hypothetical protein
MLEYRRVLVDWPLVEVTKPGQCLIDTVVASPGLAWRRALLRRFLWHRVFWRGVPWRRDAVMVVLHQALAP